MIDLNNYYDDKGTYIFRKTQYPQKQIISEYKNAEEAKAALINGIKGELKKSQKQHFDYITYGFKNSIARRTLLLPEEEREKALKLLPQEIADDVSKLISDYEKLDINKLEIDYDNLVDEAIDIPALKQLVHSVIGDLTSYEIKEILDEQIKYDLNFKEELEDAIFLFEDIVYLDDRTIQKILREIDSLELATALCGIDDEVLQKILRNLSNRAGKILIEDIQDRGPQDKKTVLWSRKRIVSVIHRLEDWGEIVINFKDDFFL